MSTAQLALGSRGALALSDAKGCAGNVVGVEGAVMLKVVLEAATLCPSVVLVATVPLAMLFANE